MDSKSYLTSLVEQTQVMYRSILKYQKLGRRVVTYISDIIGDTSTRRNNHITPWLLDNLEDINIVLVLRTSGSPWCKKVRCIIGRAFSLVKKALNLLENPDTTAQQYQYIGSYLNRACISMSKIYTAIKNDIVAAYKIIVVLEQVTMAVPFRHLRVFDNIEYSLI